jgi:DNA-binding NarL/FixJ family response regulator
MTTLAMTRHDEVTAPRKIRILIVDDHEAIRIALRALLSAEPDLTVVATVSSAEEALNVIEHEPIDLAIVDISLGQTNGLDLARQLRLQYPNTHVLILSMHDAAVYSARAAEAGASAYVAKQEAPEALVPTIRRVLAGRTCPPRDPKHTP